MIHGSGEYGTRENPDQAPVRFTISPKPLVAGIAGVPRLGFMDFTQSVVTLVSNRHQVVKPALLNGLWWERNVSIGIKQAIEGDFRKAHGRDPDYILVMDYDSLFTPEMFDKMLAFMQAHPEYAAAWPVQMSRHNERPLCYEPFLDYTTPHTEKVFGHFGMTLIRAEVFRHIPKPWLFAMPGSSGDWDDPTSVDSDIMFWRVLKDHGYKCAQVNEVMLPHLELCLVLPKHNTVQYQTIGDYRKSGLPADAVWTGRPLKENPKVLRLNLGAGKCVKPGFFSIDRKNQQDVYPLPYEDNTVDEIYASHVLEHFSHCQRHRVLYEWVRVLKPGGTLKIAVPDFRRLCARYLAGETPQNFEQWIMGGHVDPDDVHLAIYDHESLQGLMLAAGLENVEKFEPDRVFQDTSTQPYSLNLKATKTRVNLRSVDTETMADEVLAKIYKSEQTTPGLERPHGDFAWLRGAARLTGYGQFGEDSILERIADEAGIENGWAFEVGAGDGESGSNTVWCRKRGWPTVMIEGNIDKYQKLIKVPGTPINCMVEPTGPKSIDALLDSAGAPEEINLGVIDIDGDDYHVAAALRRRPKVLMVEFRNSGARPVNRQVPPPGFGQATQPAIVELGRSMGYEFVATTLVNAIFVRSDIAGKLRRPAPDSPGIGTNVVDLRADGDADWSPHDTAIFEKAGAD